jgi:hypothetical protein
MDQARAFKLNVVTVVVVAVMISLFLLYLFASNDFQLPWGYHQPEILLDCDLPTERPLMDAPLIIAPSINNSTMALNYIVEFLPQFENSTFLKEDSFGEASLEEYWGQMGEECISVCQNGDFFYTRRDANYEGYSAKEFPEDTARNISIAFIETHGGLGQYEETKVFVGRDSDTHGHVDIFGYDFQFHKRYNGYVIYGFDWICTEICPVDPIVAHYIRRVHQFGMPNETRQVISAEEAWWAARNVTYIDYMEDIKITDVELCYYFEDEAKNGTMMYPAWRFISSNIDIFVDAFTGVPIG